MERCPVCRAKIKKKVQCRRCKSDLTDLVLLKKQAEYMMFQAMQHLKNGNFSQARRVAGQSVNLQCAEYDDTILDFIDFLAQEERGTLKRIGSNSG
ncbi:MAG: hypothetical protein D3923_19060 [Candidatus Electrothrix sp. AR3]|nr:hypothetical protein [Candidatus Electrothrix sp. AR3]